MIATIRQRGISDPAILEAMGTLPRHFFLDRAFADWAYKDQAFPIGNDQTISQPYTVAFQTKLLGAKAHDRILEIGTGSGYQAAILSELGYKVYTIERQEFLFKKTSALLIKLGYHSIRTFYGDGFEGLPNLAPFDGILITAGATEVPHKLLTQLAMGGKMVIPVGTQGQQRMMRYTMTEKGLLQEAFGQFRFVPMLRNVVPYGK